MANQRRVIVHYHLFKNAGSSVDQLLRRNFMDDWVTYDRVDGGSIICTEELEQLLNEHPTAQAFSSHQLIPPLPTGDVAVFPIIFIRDPIDRIKSAYLFEWQKQLGLESPKGSFEEYIKFKLTHRRKNAIEEFQTLRLSNRQTHRYQDFENFSDDELFEFAKRLIEQLPFVGIVDRFEESTELLVKALALYWPEFTNYPTRANVLQDTSLSLATKHDNIRHELGEEIYQLICDCNRLDSRLYEFATGRFEQLCRQFSPAQGAFG